SPVDPKTIWVGTDDGVVQVTHDGGEHWNNVTSAMPGLPEWGRIQQIEASPHDANSAYVAVDFHEVDNNKPYAFKTHDSGKSWTSIAAGLPADDPARVVRKIRTAKASWCLAPIPAFSIRPMMAATGPLLNPTSPPCQSMT